MRLIIPNLRSGTLFEYIEALKNDPNSLLVAERKLETSLNMNRSFFFVDDAYTGTESIHQFLTENNILRQGICIQIIDGMAPVSQPLRALVGCRSNSLISKLFGVSVVKGPKTKITTIELKKTKMFFLLQCFFLNCFLKNQERWLSLEKILTNNYATKFIFTTEKYLLINELKNYLKNQKITIFMPDLSKPFKKQSWKFLFKFKKTRVSHNPNWHRYTDVLIKFILNNGNEYEIVQGSLHSIRKKVAKSNKFCIIPHHNWFELDKPIYGNHLFYMQVVLHDLYIFSLSGWGAYAHPVLLNKINISTEHIKAKIKHSTKYPAQYIQKSNIESKDRYLFAAQMPFDQSIRYGFDYPYAMSFKILSTIRKQTDLKIDVKLHPLLLGKQRMKMVELCRVHGLNLIEGDIKELIDSYKGVITVCSGVGMEAIFKDKHVLVLGDSDYSRFVDNIYLSFDSRGCSEPKVFINHYSEVLDKRQKILIGYRSL